MKKKIAIISVSCFVLLFVVAFCIWNAPYHRSEKLIRYIEKRDAAAVEEMLRSGVDPNVPTGPYVGGWKYWNIFFEYSPRTPLAVACDTGNLEMVKLLLSYGASPAFTQREGLAWSALSETLFYFQPDDVEIVKLLIENGVDPYHDEHFGEKPVFMAARMAPKVFDATKANGTVFATEYDEQTAKGITEIVCLLLGDESVNTTSPSRQSLLMLAAKKGNLYLANYLIDQGCDKEMVDDYGKTALDYAVEAENQKMIEILR
jgi:ankyrin repeat protein